MLSWGAALPDMSDCAGELIVPASAIRNADDRVLLDGDQRIPFLPAGATVLCKLGARHIPAGLLKALTVAVPDPTHEGAAFVEVVLREPLQLHWRGTKPAPLGDVACRIPALPEHQPSSLNEAYRRISEMFEPTRRSVGGSVFLNMFYRTTSESSLVSLDSLRDQCVGIWEAYLRTVFSADTPGVVEIRLGASSGSLDAILRRERTDTWAFVTAYNPGSRITPEDQNQRAHQELRAVVRTRGWVFFEGRGASADGNWPPEVSLLVLGVTADEACKLGRQFKQLAVVVGRRGEPARLQWCQDYVAQS